MAIATSFMRVDENAAMRPLRGMRHFVFIAVLAASGCLLPVNLTPPLDAGTRGDECTTSQTLPAWIPSIVGLGVAEIALSGCAQDVTLTGPRGEPVAVEISGSSTVRFAASTPGQYTLHLGNTEASIEVMELVEDPDSGYLFRAADRIDSCSLRGFTPSQKLVCGRGNGTWLYELDGGVQRIDHVLYATLGAELWTRSGTSVSHWSDTPRGAQLDGTIDVMIDAANTQSLVENGPGRTLIPGPDRMVVVNWDGGTSSDGGTLHLTINDQLFGLGPSLWILDGDTLWGDTLCTYEAGCANAVCDRIKTCPFGEANSVMGYDEEAIFTYGPGDHLGYPFEISRWPRPLRVDQRPTPRNINIPTDGVFATDFMHGLLLSNSDVIGVVNDDPGFHFVYLRGGGQLIGKTALLPVDPKTLRVVNLQ